MPRLIRTAFSLAGLLLLYVVHPTVAWVALGCGLASMIAVRRLRTPHAVSSS